MQPPLAPLPPEFEKRDSCPVCGGRAETVLSLRYIEEPVRSFVRWWFRKETDTLSHVRYALGRCGSCALLYQQEIGGPRFMEELYSTWVGGARDPSTIPSYTRDIGNPLQSRDAHELMAASSFLGLPMGRMRTLDYGMGWALWARIAAGLGCESWGFDLAQERMEHAVAHGVKTVREDALESVRFDFINAEQVFEHVPDPGALSERLSKALRPGGILKISVPSAERVDVAKVPGWLASNDVRHLSPVLPLEHINGFTTVALRSLAKRAGLTPVRGGLWHRYAFLRTLGTVDPRHPKQAVKELVRPLVQQRSRTNLYVWLRRG